VILLNFARKFDPISLELFHQMAGRKIDEQVMLPLEAFSTADFMAAWDKAVIKLKLTDEDLSTDRVVINPSGNLAHMQVLVAVLYKKTGKMPLIVVTRTAAFGLSARSEIQEVVDLQKWIE
jgi:hypothetical protein